MRMRGSAMLLSAAAFLSACGLGSNNAQHQIPGFVLDSLFRERPPSMYCSDPPVAAPSSGQPSSGGAGIFIAGAPRPAFTRARLQTLDLPLSQVPALTIAAEPTSWIHIAAANQDHWAINFCASGAGNTPEEAAANQDGVAMTQTGPFIALGPSNPGSGGGMGQLNVSAPAGAPITVHTLAAVEVYGMSGPVHVSAATGRATILNTTGRVDAAAASIDYAGAQGSVQLNSSHEINLKLNATEFHGGIFAYARQDIHVYAPAGFHTPIEVLVNRQKDFICRANFCAQFTKGREGSLYKFEFGGAASPAQDRIIFRSDESAVTMDMYQ